tara:strand:+ start:1616 stop:1888 length:273 start_codon:yes stop_codon:yes gene_type:complete
MAKKKAKRHSAGNQVAINQLNDYEKGRAKRKAAGKETKYWSKGTRSAQEFLAGGKSELLRAKRQIDDALTKLEARTAKTIKKAKAAKKKK